ncbi:MAG: prolipoprotein diacylglyceryl transferase [Candidatus Borkfalkiaceae bacterium]|nr:prolipoprotein diacylglyceryl transferase [Clostridia bacterium]MDY6222931.1 prolipoprotein diacylglyceryl transferase [Christensenellaceae bacterium]
MYPYEIVFGLTLYDILIGVGMVAALILFSRLADKRGLKRKLQNLVFLSAVLAICGGWFFALLTQSVYNYIETGVFEWRGMTFYGGFVGGAAIFLAVYFIGGKIAFKKTDTPDYYLREFFTVADIAVCCVAAAHALGRIGCLTAGCCHGKVYDEKHAFTVPLLTLSQSGALLKTQYTVPVQLYESLFLFALCAFLYVRAVKKQPYGLPLYLALYGVWRFFIEYARADDRGQTIVSFLSPSQLIAVVLVLASVAVFFIERRVRRVFKQKSEISGGAESAKEEKGER